MKKIYVISILIIPVLLVLWCNNNRENIQVYSHHYSAIRSKTYQIKLDNRPLFVENFRDIHYTHFSFCEKVDVTVTLNEPIKCFSISPENHIQATSIKNNILFSLSEPAKLVLKVNNCERLFIFADPIEKSPVKSKEAKVTNILNYGVKGNGKILETSTIQKAIDDVSGTGGILFFPAGIYLTGTLSIKSDMTLCLSGGAVIQGSPNRQDYPVDYGWKESDMKYDPENWTNNGEKMTYSRLILIDSARNVRIMGRGTIDGNGKTIRDQGKPANLIRIRNSQNILVEGIILRDPAAWNTHILFSKNITFRNVKVINDRSVKNTDGINPDASQHVIIDRCFAYCGDDNIAIKSTNNSGLLQDVDDIVVKNCILLTKKSALKLGTETKADFMKNITFKNNDVIEADRGISLYCMDGTTFENIRFINNRFENFYKDKHQKTMHFRIHDRSRAGHIRNVLIKNCYFKQFSPNNPVFQGLDDQHQISDVHFENLVIEDKVCRNMTDVRLEMNDYVKDITFSVISLED